MKIFFRICFGMAMWLSGSAAVIWAQSSNTLSPEDSVTSGSEARACAKHSTMNIGTQVNADDSVECKWLPGRNGPFEFRTATGLFPGGCSDWYQFLDWHWPVDSLSQPDTYLRPIESQMQTEAETAYTPCATGGMPPMRPLFATREGVDLQPIVFRIVVNYVSDAGPYHPEWETLMAHLENSDERARLVAVENLVRIRTTGSLTALLTSLREDPSPQVRLAAAKSLTLLGDIQAVAGLTRAASADPDATVRQIAAFGAQILGGVVAPKPIRESKPSRDLGMGFVGDLYEF